MKLALWLTTLGLLVLAAGCSVNHRSGDFACDDHTACANNRTCVNGFCVVVDASTPDARACPSACTSCTAGTKLCTIDCSVNGGCTGAVVCPAGWNCSVLCSTLNSCRNGVTCPSGNTCAITCSGARSCQNVACGSGPCKVECTGSGACRDVRCDSSCACDVSCSVFPCTNLTCTPGCSLPASAGCTSVGASCNTCK